MNDWLGVEEVAALLHVAPQTIYNLVWQRKLPHYKPGGKLLFSRQEIEKIIIRSKKRSAGLKSCPTVVPTEVRLLSSARFDSAAGH